MFLTNALFCQNYATAIVIAPIEMESEHLGPVMVWLNLDSKEEADELYHRWQSRHKDCLRAGRKARGACASSRVADLDDNQLRVFCDFSSDAPQEQG